MIAWLSVMSGLCGMEERLRFERYHCMMSAMTTAAIECGLYVVVNCIYHEIWLGLRQYLHSEW